jgi:hypothetical protein
VTKRHTPETFWERVDRRGDSECWPFIGPTTDGYGLLSYGGKVTRAHRVAYRLAGGTVDPGHHIMHSCDNRACCNPSHLSSGSPAENVRDMWSKGRARVPIGTESGQAKLTREAVGIIREWPLRGTQAAHELAERFGVGWRSIYRVWQGLTYRDVPR